MKEYIIKVPEPESKLMGIKEYKTCFGLPITELIRCKDCKYNILRPVPYDDNAVMMQSYVHCDYMAFKFGGEGYCALAERKEE